MTHETEDRTDALIEAHREALEMYRHWDEQIKGLLKGRRMRDLNVEDMEVYREVAKKRDAAYSRMRALERELLDNIPGASTGPFTPLRRGDQNN